ncbi:MAG: hypothetical protein ACP5HK_03315 [Acidilobus sp.]
MRALVSGLLTFDSGKTVLTASLIRGLIREGVSAAASKPLGATDLWGHPEALLRSRGAREVVTYDGYALAKASGDRLPVEVVNPVGALLAPTPPSRYRGRSAFEASLVEPFRRAVLVRVTTCVGESRSLHLANVDALSRVSRNVSEAIEEVSAYLTPPPAAASDDAIASVFSGGASAAADTCVSLAEKASEVLVIESNSDVAAPTAQSAYPSVAIFVAPGEAYVVDGQRFSRALEVLSMSGRPWVAKTYEVLELTGYMDRVDLPLLEDPDEGYQPDDVRALLDRIKGVLRERRSARP